MSSLGGGSYRERDEKNTSITQLFVSGLIIIAIVIALVLLATSGGRSDPSPADTSLAQAETLYPEPINYVVDAAGALSTDQIQSLQRLVKQADNDKHQFGVAVVKSTKPLDITEYGIKLAEKWKVGNADTDNGAIIIIATEDRKVRIEVGYGLEGDITDAEAGRILDNDMVPFLRENDWYGAINAGIIALQAHVN